MAIALGRCCLRMAEDGTNDRKAKAESGADTGVAVAQVVDAEAIEVGSGAQCFPCLVEVSPRLFWIGAKNDESTPAG